MENFFLEDILKRLSYTLIALPMFFLSYVFNIMLKGSQEHGYGTFSVAALLVTFSILAFITYKRAKDIGVMSYVYVWIGVTVASLIYNIFAISYIISAASEAAEFSGTTAAVVGGIGIALKAVKWSIYLAMFFVPSKKEKVIIDLGSSGAQLRGV
jgi:hypothetical protein